jgi:hypothetical protein
MATTAALDEATLRLLNDKYIEAFMTCNVDWYREILVEDFRCIAVDGSILNKENFLMKAAKEPTVSEYRLSEVDIRIYSDVGLVQATGSFLRKDGTRGKNRYTDVYVRNGSKWEVVTAQITAVTS